MLGLQGTESASHGTFLCHCLGCPWKPTQQDQWGSWVPLQSIHWVLPKTRVYPPLFLQQSELKGLYQFICCVPSLTLQSWWTALSWLGFQPGFHPGGWFSSKPIYLPLGCPRQGQEQSDPRESFPGCSNPSFQWFSITSREVKVTNLLATAEQ